MCSMNRNIALCFLLAIVLLTSCAGPGSSSADEKVAAPASSPVNFRITWTEYSGRGEAIGAIVDAYNGQNTGGSTIAMLGGDEDINAIQSLMETNPGTVFVLPYRYVKYLGKAGLLADLTSSFQDSKALFYPEIWNLGTVDGASYGIPWLGHSMCLLYNKSLLSKAGVVPDSINSMQALLDAIEAVEQKTDAQGIGLVGADSNDVSWMVNQFIYGFGSSLISADGKAVAMNTGSAKDALLYYRDVLGMHAQPTWKNDTGVEVMACFRKQEIAFEIQGIWGVTDIQKNGDPFDVGVISMKDVGLCSEVGPMMLSLPTAMSAAMKQDALQFLHYMISEPAQEKIMDGEYSPEHDTCYPFRTPIRIDMADDTNIKNNPGYVKFIEGFQNPSIDVPVPAWETIKTEVYQPGLHRFMLGEITADDLLNKLETEGNKILGEQK